jgi:hypothetical protein
MSHRIHTLLAVIALVAAPTLAQAGRISIEVVDQQVLRPPATTPLLHASRTSSGTGAWARPDD